MTNAFVGPRGRDVARKLIDATEELGLDPQVVLTTRGGYLVPMEVVDHLDEKEAAAQKEAEQKVADAAAALVAKEEAAKVAAEKAEAEKVAAEKEEAAKAEPEKTTARAPRAKRNTKASDAGEEKD